MTPSATSAREVLNRATTEDELLTAVTDALTLYGWRWTHHRRSDKALLMGHPGFPDICAARKGKVLFLELKTQTGRLSEDQQAWIAALNPDNWSVIRPTDLSWFIKDLERES